MSLPTFSAKESTPIVIDASVAINLAASGIGGAVLAALPSRTFIVTHAVEEVERGCLQDQGEISELRRWANRNLIQELELDDEENEIFASLIIGPAAQTLDDGEAATIAVARSRRFIPVIDERKANRIFQERFPGLPKAATVDLFCHDSVGAALTHQELAEGVFKALSAARMRVLPQHMDWTVHLIGHHRAIQCPSLPASVRSQLIAQQGPTI